MVGPREPVPFETFASALGFSVQDLEANRAGRLSDKQRVLIEQLIVQHIATRRRWALVLRATAVLVACWPALGFGSAIIHGPLYLDIILINACIVFFVILTFVLTRSSAGAPPRVPGLVQQAVGPASYQQRAAADNDGTLDLCVAGWAFMWLAVGSTPVPPVFTSGAGYRVFFVLLDLRSIAGSVERSWMRFPVLLSAERA
jgi:hypothetical protein